MRPLAGYQGEELSTSLSVSIPQEAAQSNEATPSLLLSKPDKPHVLGHCSESIPSSPFNGFISPLLAAFKDLHILFKLQVPELQIILKVRPHQC